MKTKIRLFVIAAVLVDVSACTTIKNLFPDKEKDYQFTTEIPPLILPPDLAGDASAKLPTPPAAPATTPSAPAAESVDEVPAYTPTETAPAIDRNLIQVELIDAESGAKRLRISAPSEIAWRMVGKALSRKSIEVTNRNQDDRVFDVQYDQSKQDVKDGSVWDELVFMFKGFEANEQAFTVKLQESNQQTDVMILDKDQKPVSDDASLSLTMLLYDTLKADLAK
ncbi:MAG: outer membrane protein assembly factor BamC [Methylobacter sp.]|nr:outer membrane protein assembly factor BamC [Methylobacter sp.]